MPRSHWKAGWIAVFMLVALGTTTLLWGNASAKLGDPTQDPYGSVSDDGTPLEDPDWTPNPGPAKSDSGDPTGSDLREGGVRVPHQPAPAQKELRRSWHIFLAPWVWKALRFWA